MEKCEINVKIPSLNEYINACRENRFTAARMKRETEAAIWVDIRKLPRFTGPVVIHFTWIEPNRRRDLDNVAFGKKFILDALVENGKLPDDGQKYVKGFTDSFQLGERSKVIIEIEKKEESI